MRTPLLGALTAGLLLLFCLGCQQKRVTATADVHGGESAEEHAAHGHDEHGHDEHGHEGESAAEHAAHDEDGHEAHPAEEAGGDHAGHDHAALIQITPEQMKQYGVQTAIAKGGNLDLYLTLPGEAAVNEDKVGHVLPKLAGVVKQVNGNLGDSVKKGQRLVVVESRELAEAKADYLAARESRTITLSNEERERTLFEKGVSPQQDYINATNARREADIRVRGAEQALHALGVSEAQIKAVVANPHESMTRYEIYAPMSGRILEKHVSLGEMVSTDDELFLIADLSTVWVNLNVSQKDLPKVREGQRVRIRFSPTAGVEVGTLGTEPSGIPDAEGRIKYIDALVAEDTRTARARIVLSNPGGKWKPGMFVTGLISVDDAPAQVMVPLEALIKFEGADNVFVKDEHGFEPRTVTLGKISATHIEIISGLKPGEEYVSKGAFTVKAELGKSEAGHGH
jgi:cobalt-zinc-cadmium efflux system membrane fusion protein